MHEYYEYKVISERDAKVSGSFDLNSLEVSLNEHGSQGWRVVEGLVATSVWKSGKTEIVMIMERAVDVEGR